MMIEVGPIEDARYPAPLEPGLSGEESLGKVPGDTAAARRNCWTIHGLWAQGFRTVRMPNTGKSYLSDSIGSLHSLPFGGLL